MYLLIHHVFIQSRHGHQPFLLLWKLTLCSFLAPTQPSDLCCSLTFTSVAFPVLQWACFALSLVLHSILIFVYIGANNFDTTWWLFLPLESTKKGGTRSKSPCMGFRPIKGHSFIHSFIGQLFTSPFFKCQVIFYCREKYTAQVTWRLLSKSERDKKNTNGVCHFFILHYITINEEK